MLLAARRLRSRAATRRRCVGEEVGSGEEFFVSHGRPNGTTLAGVSLSSQTSPECVDHRGGRRFGRAVRSPEAVRDARSTARHRPGGRSAARGRRRCGAGRARRRRGSAKVGSPAARRRSESVRAGLAAVPADATIVCVHDAARPFADADLFDACHRGRGRPVPTRAIPGVPVTDTIKRDRRRRRPSS